MDAWMWQFYNIVPCESRELFVAAKVEMRDPKRVTINNDENGKKVEAKKSSQNSETKRERNVSIMKMKKFLCERQNGWGGAGPGRDWAQARRDRKWWNFIYLYLCIYLSQQNENKAFSPLHRRAGSCHSGRHRHTAKAFTLWTQQRLWRSSLCLLRVRLNFIYSFCFSKN